MSGPLWAYEGDITGFLPRSGYSDGVKTANGISFLLRLNDEASPSPLDLSGMRATLSKATDNCRVVVEGLVGSPSPRVLGSWTPVNDLSRDEIPGYTMSYAPRSHPLRSTPITIPRIQPFAQIGEWRDAVLKAAEDWAATQA